MRVLTAKWTTANRVSPSGVVTGESDGEDAEKPMADKPMFIYVTDGSAGEDGFDKIEKVILDDNKILIGTHVFRCIKMTPEDVENDPLLSGKSDDERYFIFVSRDYEDVEVLDGSKLKKKKVYSTMKKFAKKAYKTNFEKNVKAVLKLTNEFDKINGAMRTLKQKVHVRRVLIGLIRFGLRVESNSSDGVMNETILMKIEAMKKPITNFGNRSRITLPLGRTPPLSRSQ